MKAHILNIMKVSRYSLRVIILPERIIIALLIEFFLCKIFYIKLLFVGEGRCTWKSLGICLNYIDTITKRS
jgi:hypothetical protein